MSCSGFLRGTDLDLSWICSRKAFQKFILGKKERRPSHFGCSINRNLFFFKQIVIAVEYHTDMGWHYYFFSIFKLQYLWNSSPDPDCFREHHLPCVWEAVRSLQRDWPFKYFRDFKHPSLTLICATHLRVHIHIATFLTLNCHQVVF